MCDTMWKQIGGESVFLKNSDRAANEPNLVVFSPGRKSNGTLRCTYAEIPDANSFAAVLYKPSWIWGAEMGVNEKGVAIGNEAVFTKSVDKKTQGLIGMDFLRLALERGDTAEHAAQVITDLLQQHGQAGNCGYESKFCYDNSYLIADRHGALVLETAGKKWTLKKLCGCGNISNRLSVTDGGFSKANTEPLYTFFSGSKQRQAQGAAALAKAADLKDCFSALRSHRHGDAEKLLRCGSVRSVCMHAGILGDQTTGSMVVVLRENLTSIWVTGSSTPCLSVFKPIYFAENCGAPMFNEAAQAEAAQYWLKRERINRAIFAGHLDFLLQHKLASELETEFINEEKELLGRGSSLEEMVAFSARCAKKEQRIVDAYDPHMRDFSDTKLPAHWRRRQKNLGKNMFGTER